MTTLRENSWTVKIGAAPPNTGDRPRHKWTRDELDQSREYWHARIKAIEEHPKMPAQAKANEIRFCHYWLQQTMEAIRNQGMGPCFDTST